jgi:DNA-binding Lrp family transcriptional regulator
MDEKDKEILRYLSLDARMSAAEIGRNMKISRMTVQNRIDRLLANETISRFTVELGENVESVLIEAVIMVKLETGDSSSTLKRIIRLSEVMGVTSLSGNYDLLVEVRATSLTRMDELLLEIRRLPYILETESSIRLKRYK